MTARQWARDRARAKASFSPPMPSHRIVLTVAADQPGPGISRHLFGQFAEHLGTCVYDSIWVGEDSSIPHVRGIRQGVVDALREIRMPNIRWPG